jgi:hypothetical protein
MADISEKVLAQREASRRYYLANKEEICKKKKVFSKLHPIRVARQKKADYQKHRIKRLATVKAYADKHREKIAEASREWRRLHPLKTKAHRLKSKHNYRARLVKAEGSFTFQEFKDLCKKYNHCCVCCGKTKQQLSKIKRALVPDHVKPISKGGSNYIENIQPLCHPLFGGRGGCNSRKRAKEFDYRNTDIAKSLIKLTKGV